MSNLLRASAVNRYSSPVPISTPRRHRPSHPPSTHRSPTLDQSDRLSSADIDRPEASSRQTPVRGVARSLGVIHRSLADGLQERLDAIVIDLDPVRPPFVDLKEDVSNRPFDPDGTCDSDLAIELVHALEYEGYAGVTKVLIREANEFQQEGFAKSRNYNVISKENAIDMMMILATMRRAFLEHLIKGDIMYEYFRSRDFRSQVDPYHSLQMDPGNYYQCCVRVEWEEPDAPPTGSTQVSQAGKLNKWRGRWLSARQIVDIHTGMERYISDWPFAKRVDRVYHSGKPELADANYQAGERRYVNDANQSKFEDFLAAWDKLFIKRISAMIKADANDSKLDVPLRWCPVEIGWSALVKTRANAHDTHDSSNKLWTLYLALVRLLVDKHEKLLEVARFQTNHLAVVRDQLNQARISDVMQTMLARSEWFHGGFNPVPGGGAGVQENALVNADPWMKVNFNIMYRASDRNIVWSNVQKDRQKIEAWSNMQHMYDDRWQAAERQAIEDEKLALMDQKVRIHKKIERMRMLEVNAEAQRLDKQHKASLALERKSKTVLPSIEEDDES